MRHAFQNTLLMVAGGTLLPLALLAQEPRPAAKNTTKTIPIVMGAPGSILSGQA